MRATAKLPTESVASLVLIRRLQRWQELLKRTRPSILTPDEIKGLIGELLFLKDILSVAFGCDAAVAAWRGPEGGPQDFAINDTAVEIKCQSGGSKPVIRINSADQLSPQLPSGYLVVYTLAGQADENIDAINLNSLVTGIREDLMASAAVAARERFEDLLYMAGYLTSEEYDEHRFVVVAIKSYHLTDGFPRIVNSGLIAGVERISYSVRLEACSGFQSKPTWWPI